jgi:hypothetical protein
VYLDERRARGAVAGLRLDPDYTVGTPLTFTVKAGDLDAGDVVELGDGAADGSTARRRCRRANRCRRTSADLRPWATPGSHVTYVTAFDGCAAGPTQCSFTVHAQAAGACSSTNVALFDAPTPGCGSTLQATVGDPFTITVKAGDADKGDVVQLNATALPAGAKLSTALPASGNPVSTDFIWTPAAVEVSLIFSADEAVGSYWLDDIPPCPCGS